MKLTSLKDLAAQLDNSQTLMAWAQDLFPICRSITGNGVRQTLGYINQQLGGSLTLHEIPTGTKVFDWEVPREWNIRSAWIKDSQGNKIIDFANNNLHLMGYSTSVNQVMPLEKLQEHLYSLPEMPTAIPYVTSYYKERWGFCLTHEQRQALTPGNYHVVIDSTLEAGHLSYGELIIQGQTNQEILISTYTCHPSMANNEVSGPVVATALARWLQKNKPYYTYRFIWGPETIGAITYLSKHLAHLKTHLKMGFILTCVGDNGPYSIVQSRYANTLADKLSHAVLNWYAQPVNIFSFLQRGSDERQYGAPGVELPVVTFSRSKFGLYEQYHTSLDNLDYICGDGLFNSLQLLAKMLVIQENNFYYTTQCLCEPQLGKRGLYPTLSTKDSGIAMRNMMNFITYCDGKNDLLDICQIINSTPEALAESIEQLTASGLIAH